MGEVVDLPVITTQNYDAEFALRKAAEADLESAVVVGWKLDGSFFFGSSISAAPEVIMLLEMAKAKLVKMVLDADEGKT